MSVDQLKIESLEEGRKTVYTMPHSLAFKWLEESVCGKFHATGNFLARTNLEVSNGEGVFTVTVINQDAGSYRQPTEAKDSK